MGFIAAAACLALAAAFARDPKPDASIKNRNVEASVVLDDSLSALCRRSLCRRSVYRVRAMGKPEAAFDAGGVEDFRRRAA